jgi:hypothetical protein
MDDETHSLEVAAADREAFVLCLALGTLEAMRSGAWPLEAGTWTLNRPGFWQPVASSGVAAEVVAELEAADELDTLARLCGRPAADAMLDRMIAAVRSRLSALEERSWYARWSERPVTPADSAERRTESPDKL